MKPYRAPSIEAPDREPEAGAELRRRAYRVRRNAAAACMTAPILGAFPGYFLLQELQFRVIGGFAWPAVSVIVGVFLPLALGMRGTVKLARRTLLRRRDPWLDEIAATYKVPRRDLVKYTTSWRM